MTQNGISHSSFLLSESKQMFSGAVLWPCSSQASLCLLYSLTAGSAASPTCGSGFLGPGERGWGELGRGAIKGEWFSLHVRIILLLVELFMNLHIISECHDDRLRQLLTKYYLVLIIIKGVTHWSLQTLRTILHKALLEMFY